MTARPGEAREPVGMLMRGATGLRGRVAAGGLGLGLVLAMVPGAAAVAPVRTTLGTTPTTTIFEPLELTPKPVGRTAVARVSVEPAGATGTLSFYDDHGDGTRDLLSSGPLAPDSTAALQLADDMPVATYHLVAVYSGDATYASSDGGPVTLVVGPRPTSTTVSVTGPHDGTGATARKGDVLMVTAGVADTGQYTPNAIPIVGTVTVSMDGNSVGTVSPGGQLPVATAALGLGSHSIAASYDGGDGVDHDASVGSSTVNLLAAQVEATGVGVGHATFYPYRDGYLDTDRVGGTRLERASVAISIYDPAGKKIRSVAIAAGSGPYGYWWNGRTSAGSLLPAGTYSVRQVLRNGAGVTTTVTRDVHLSRKRLVDYTAWVTKRGSSWFATSGGPVQRSTAEGWARLPGNAAGSTIVAWELTLPAAPVYRSIAFRADVRTVDAGMALQSFRLCGGFAFSNCFDRSRMIGRSSGSTAWYAVSGSVSANRSGRLVRGVVYTWDHPAIVYKVQVKVVYALLR